MEGAWRKTSPQYHHVRQWDSFSSNVFIAVWILQIILGANARRSHECHVTQQEGYSTNVFIVAWILLITLAAIARRSQKCRVSTSVFTVAWNLQIILGAIVRRSEKGKNPTHPGMASEPCVNGKRTTDTRV